MTLITDITRDQETARHDEIIVKEAQQFYDAARRAEQRGEPVRALLHRNIAYQIQHGTTEI